MAQLNPNFEIDFNDINSYEQIQLINDTQLAKENLLMHKAYKEPAEDEIIRNQFSSFTFVDFCPKLITTKTNGPTAVPAGQHNHKKNRRATSNSLRPHQYELETFSDLFDRINSWLKSNKDWRVVSMETLIFDCTSQFNHLKSSIHLSFLPRNMRGLRLYLSPSKSRFSGPQKIGCINVIPRKTRGSYSSDAHLASGSSSQTSESLEYETLDEILARLNELLLTRPIEGRILSVETITLPIVKGYVNTETNYLMDNRLNLLSQRVYSHATAANEREQQTAGDAKLAALQQQQSYSNGLIDILRVYYEFGPIVCGLVNLIDFLPRFRLHTQAAGQSCKLGAGKSSNLENESGREDSSSEEEEEEQQQEDQDDERKHSQGGNSFEIDSTESLTRLIGRSLSWFEAERKRFLNLRQTNETPEDNCQQDESPGSNLVDVVQGELEKTLHEQQMESCGAAACNENNKVDKSLGAKTNNRQKCTARPSAIDLKMCNLQIHTKVMLKSQLVRVTPETALERLQTRKMFHAPPREKLVCHQCAPIGLDSVKVTPVLAATTPETRQKSDKSNSVNELEAPQGISSTTTYEAHEWCSHLLDLNQPFELKFVRLAYVVPVHNLTSRKFVSSLRSLPNLKATSDEQLAANRSSRRRNSNASPPSPAGNNCDLLHSSECVEPDRDGPSLGSSTLSSSSSSSSSSSTSSSTSTSDSSRECSKSRATDKDDDEEERDGPKVKSSRKEDEDEEEEENLKPEQDEPEVGAILAAHLDAEQVAKQASLEIVAETNRRQRANEQVHQLAGDDQHQQAGPSSSQNSASTATVNSEGKLIGQLTYRLFAPCQLVNSSSCFSINPVNSSSPLARRGSVDLNGGGSLSSDNATPSSLLLPPSDGNSISGSFSESTLSINQQQQQQPTMQAQHHQQIISFGAFFPALSHDILATTTSGDIRHHNNNNNSNPSSSGHRFNTNEFESVEAIRRRMEVYVTTNSMKVLAGETLIVNLSDHLSCLSNAIEQTIVKASFLTSRPPSTWVSVYVLYAAVDEPHLPSQLLEQQKLRERLELISEADEDTAAATGVVQDGQTQVKSNTGNGVAGGSSPAISTTKSSSVANHGEDNSVPVFDDDFIMTNDVNKRAQVDATNQTNANETNLANKSAKQKLTVTPASESFKEQREQQQVANTMASLNLEDGSIRVELRRDSGASEQPLYNSAYDRTVALPTQPDHHLTDHYLEPVDFNLVGSLSVGGGGGGGSACVGGGAKTDAQLVADNMWLDEHDLIDVQSYHLSDSNVRDGSKLLRLRKQKQVLDATGRAGLMGEANKSKMKRASKGKRSRRDKHSGRRSSRGEDSQCSII